MFETGQKSFSCGPPFRLFWSVKYSVLVSGWGQHKIAENALFGQIKDYNSGRKHGN